MVITSDVSLEPLRTSTSESRSRLLRAAADTLPVTPTIRAYASLSVSTPLCRATITIRSFPVMSAAPTMTFASELMSNRAMPSVSEARPSVLAHAQASASSPKTLACNCTSPATSVTPLPTVVVVTAVTSVSASTLLEPMPVSESVFAWLCAPMVDSAWTVRVPSSAVVTFVPAPSVVVVESYTSPSDLTPMPLASAKPPPSTLAICALL